MAVTSAASRGAPRYERRAPQLTYASFESRIVAATLDILVLFIIAALLVTIGSIVVLVSSDFERTDPSTLSINVFWACVGAIAPASLIYLFVSYAWKGQTVGKAVMQLMVIRSSGRPLGFFGALARVIGILAYPLLFAFGALTAFTFRDSTAIAAVAVGIGVILAVAGVLMAAFDARRRMLHDRIAGTIVVRMH
jgi:uncharacterized RDD family membrane protein YckC